jgi:glycosyltransferase involved in cell wall biosynthesis
MVSSADEVVAGNSFLAERASAFNRRVTVIPSPIDLSRYSVRPPASDPRSVTLGWIGAPGSLHYLERLKPALVEAYRRDSRIRLKIICSTFPDFSPVPVDKVPWREETEVEELRSMDIGLMPLLEDDWSRGKCGLKILQYLAAGVTVVATPVGINADIVADGVEGFRASTQEHWVDRILLLASDPKLRSAMGLAGRKTVESRYSLEGCLPLMEKVLRG